MSASIKATVPSSADDCSARRRSMAMKAACAPTGCPATSSRRSARASTASMPPQGTSLARSSSAASGSCSTTRDRPKIMAEAMPLSRVCSSLPSSLRQAGSAPSGSCATVAASEVAARRHSLGPSRGARSRWISAARRGAAIASSPRATATCRHTSDSRSVMSRLHAVRTVGRSKTRMPLSSPSLARLAASRAARSSELGGQAPRGQGADGMSGQPVALELGPRHQRQGQAVDVRHRRQAAGAATGPRARGSARRRAPAATTAPARWPG